MIWAFLDCFIELLRKYLRLDTDTKQHLFYQTWLCEYFIARMSLLDALSDILYDDLDYESTKSLE